MQNPPNFAKFFDENNSNIFIPFLTNSFIYEEIFPLSTSERSNGRYVHCL